MEARFRRDYMGEFIVLESKWSKGKKTQSREWINNPIENQHISGRAVCIFGQQEQTVFDYTILQRHRGGLLGSLKLQTYSVGSVAEQMRLDFTVEVDEAQLQKLIDIEYFENNVIYTTAKNCLRHPGDFYLIPLNPRLLLPSLPVYLAAFDGHSEVFLIGYNRDTEFVNSEWVAQLSTVFAAYSGVKFYLVGEPTNTHAAWLELPNVKTMSYRDFIGYCDV